MAEIQTGFFTHEIQLRRLDNLGDPLKAIGEAVDFEMFRPLLDRLLGMRVAGPGRPPWDRVLMFKILVLQLVRGLSDEKIEFELVDSASAQRFAGLSPHDAVPDSRTVWLLRDTLAKSQLPPEGGSGENTDGVRALFELFHRELAAKGLLCREGRTVDAMIVEVPRQRNPKEENQQIKKGQVPARRGGDSLASSPRRTPTRAGPSSGAAPTTATKQHRGRQQRQLHPRLRGGTRHRARLQDHS